MRLCDNIGPGAPNSTILEMMIDGLELDSKHEQMFRKITEGAQIDRRYSVLNSIDDIYWGKHGLHNDAGIEVRNAVYKQQAPALSIQSCKEAIKDWKGSLSEITHVVAVSCTGIIVPGIEFHVMRGLGLNESCERLSVLYMGCFGFISGLKTAKALASESSNNRVLMVCTELCSLHMQLDDRIDNLVGSAIFGDGSGACIIGCKLRSNERALYEVHKTASVVIPDTLDHMDWILSHSGMIIGLGKQIPQKIYDNIHPFLSQLLSHTPAYGTVNSDMQYAIHPGGPMILNCIQDALNIRQNDTQAAWNVLKRFGNMSSATLIFVLQEMRKHKHNKSSTFIPTIAFGT